MAPMNGGSLTPWQKVLSIYGPLAVICGYLVWVLAGGVQADTRASVQMLQQHMGQTATIESLLREHTTQLDILILLQKTTCTNAADTQKERDECREASRR